jgi:hypothetical protein
MKKKKKTEGTGDKGSGDSTVIGVESLMVAFLKMCMKYSCIIDKTFAM